MAEPVRPTEPTPPAGHRVFTVAELRAHALAELTNAAARPDSDEDEQEGDDA